MNFELDNDTRAAVEMARDFARRELLPHYRRRSTELTLDMELWKQMAGLGLVGLRVREEHGGIQASDLTAGLVLKEIGYGDFNAAYGLVLQHLMTELVDQTGGEEVRAEWLPAVAAGDRMLGFGLTEPDAGSDAKAVRARARIKDDGSAVLNGEKTSTTIALQGDAFVVFCRTDNGDDIEGFFVPADSDGLTRGAFVDMGCIPLNRGWLGLDDVHVAPEHRMVRGGRSLRAPLTAIDYARIHVCLMCIGAALASVDEASEYAKQRVAFGSPIARFEDVSFKIVEARTMLNAAELQCTRALWAKDNGLDYTIDAAMVKSWIPRLCSNVIHDMLLIFGHGGYTDEVLLQQRLRDVIGFEIADGTAAIQNLHLVKSWLGREFLPYGDSNGTGAETARSVGAPSGEAVSA